METWIYMGIMHNIWGTWVTVTEKHIQGCPKILGHILKLNNKSSNFFRRVRFRRLIIEYFDKANNEKNSSKKFSTVIIHKYIHKHTEYKSYR